MLLAPLAYAAGCSGALGQPAAPQAIPDVRTTSAAPEFVGAPADSARVGQDYNYQPTVKGASADTLHFTAVNLPPWARLDPKTGAITGRPATTHIGAHESIAITVTDGSQRKATSREFAITVLGPASGVARLQWPAPVSKVDGSLLDDLAGFRILYGRDPEELDHSVWISNPDARSHEFATLEEGAWYFAIVSVSVSGLEGPATLPTRKII